MGLSVGTVMLEKYNPKWVEMFELEEENLKRLFGEYALSIEHIGSTAIPGLSAKPIIDIAVGVKSIKDFELVKDKFLKDDNYSIKEDLENDEILIRKGLESNRTHFIHIMEIDGERYKNTMLFRDFLRTHPSDLKEYENLKEKLAKKYYNDRVMYTKSKIDFISNILTKAKAIEKI